MTSPARRRSCSATSTTSCAPMHTPGLLCSPHVCWHEQQAWPACAPTSLCTGCARGGQPFLTLTGAPDRPQVDYVLNKTKEDMFSSPILSEAYAAGSIKGSLALPKEYSGQAPAGWDKP